MHLVPLGRILKINYSHLTRTEGWRHPRGPRSKVLSVLFVRNAEKMEFFLLTVRLSSTVIWILAYNNDFDSS